MLRYGKHLRMAAEREQMELMDQGERQQDEFDNGVMDAEPA